MIFLFSKSFSLENLVGYQKKCTVDENFEL